MRILILGLVIFLGACSGDDAETCSKSHRVGTFVVHYETESGDCGLLPDEVATVTDPDGVAVGCSLVSPDTWSGDECTNKRHARCDGADGSSLELITEVTEQSADSYAGTFSTTLRDAGGIPSCSGRYRVTYERR
jgi:hypothetical protein